MPVPGMASSLTKSYKALSTVRSIYATVAGIALQTLGSDPLFQFHSCRWSYPYYSDFGGVRRSARGLVS